MKAFMREQCAGALLWPLFIILILFTLSFVVYSGVTVYTKYQQEETELQRAAVITVDNSMFNANVRDLELDVPAISASNLLEENLRNSGWIWDNGDWIKRIGDKEIYRFENMQIEIDGRLMQIETTAAIPLPWEIQDIAIVRIPLVVRASILYINK